jgi:Uma2 family endonuclease
MHMPALVPHYTAEEIRRFPDDRLRYEVIRGELYVTPAPGTRHQRAVLELARALASYVEQHGLGETIVAPFEVELAEDTAVQPDVLVILGDRAGQLTPERLLGPPSLAVEVISYSSKRTDRLPKRALYMEVGVQEYWVIDCDLRHIERWRPGADAPDILTDAVRWHPQPDAPSLTIDLSTLFRRVWR